MFEMTVTVLLGLLGGVAVGVQSVIAGAMSPRVGSAASSFVIHLSGAVLSALLLLARGGEQIQNWRSLSWYMFGAGGFGLVLYLTLSQTFPQFGATTAVILIMIGQLVTGLIIDQFGLFGAPVRPADGVRVVGGLMVLIGGYFVVRQ
jgi:transporter family-2 protein